VGTHPQTLAGAVGTLGLGLILDFALAGPPSPLKARLSDRTAYLS
jgi:hypothetical protein